MRKLVRIIAILIVITLPAGCAPGNDTESAMQSASGGSAVTAENINLKDINISVNADETIVTLSMISGSRNSDYPETMLLGLPEYSVVQLPSPYRIMITLQNIVFCDYQVKDSWALSDFLPGLFQEAPAANDSLIIYLQLSGPAAFSVEESEGELTIKLKPAEAETATRYYCISNSFFEHQEGRWPQDIDMMPVLCADLDNKLLISQPFDTREAAESYRDSISEELKSVLPDSSLNVVELPPGSLPDYTAIDYSIAEGRKVLMVQGTPVSVPLLLQNGRYLAASSDGRIAFSRSYRSEEPSEVQDENLNSEKLWILDVNGRAQSLDTPDSGMIFSVIDSAQFSCDSRYLCIRDVSIEDSILYVYDLNTKTLWNLGEEGFGDQTVDFAWSDMDDTLYAMSGFDDNLQMQSCTFAEDGSFSIDAVEEQAGAAGRIGISQGRLYFADNDTGMISEVGETRTEITAGADFRISPGGVSMAVLETSVVDGEQVLTNLKLCDIVTGECVELAENADIVSFGFSADGGTVYYTDGAIGDEAADGYPFGLYAYDIASGEKEMLALSSTGDIAVGASGAIYLIQYFSEAASSFYATYQYNG